MHLCGKHSEYRMSKMLTFYIHMWRLYGLFLFKQKKNMSPPHLWTETLLGKLYATRKQIKTWAGAGEYR